MKTYYTIEEHDTLCDSWYQSYLTDSLSDVVVTSNMFLCSPDCDDVRIAEYRENLDGSFEFVRTIEEGE